MSAVARNSRIGDVKLLIAPSILSIPFSSFLATKQKFCSVPFCCVLTQCPPSVQQLGADFALRSISTKSSSGDETANVNCFTTTSYTYDKVQQIRAETPAHT